MKIVFTFPGQGAQIPGMLQDVPDYVHKAERIIGASILDDEKAFQSTIWIQLALFLKGVAVAERLIEKDVYPQFVAGHSIGAFAAAVISGVLSFEDALKMVWHRAKRMVEAYPEGYGMGVICGLTETEVKKAVDLAYHEQLPVYLSNLNAEQQIAVSGSWQGIEKAFQIAQKLGAQKTTILQVPIPSHSPLMSDLSEELLDLMSKVTLKDANIPYLANRTGRVLRDKNKIAEDLALNVAFPVRWNDMTEVCVESGADCFIEIPPGHVLSKLVKQAHETTRQIVVDEVGLEATQYLIKKWKEHKE
ncbi:malonate decarboxylase subunit epsilon [Neobacillus cucumis]|uniref:ACP S-malonyltransferase n=1 Tax=Neobacillus cucumis TaxID=1740721 RepID=UPI002E1E47DA|nr:malonate decarboxylase subunit epsilon [Neobacillus cucumis]